ncbi:MAG TPA: hypothetical protein VFD11_09485 [Thiopseudomonas sp.]|nr:hypothetical protein [Thiopseudomonas sp.]
MLDPDNKIGANSTWEPPPRKQWQIKFIASLALFGFLVGMMIGRLLEEPQQPEYSKQIVQIQTFANGLGVCLTSAVQVQAVAEQGAYQLRLLNAWGQAAQGEISMPGSSPVRWQLQPVNNRVHITFIGLQALTGQWRPRLADEGRWCADVELRVQEESRG